MNHALATLLVLNCWSTPLIRRAFGSATRVFTARLLNLAVGVALGIVSYIVIPVALFLPYAADFDPGLASFSNRFWYTDRWLVGILNEWRMLFVTSLWDGVSRFLIAATIARSLRAMPSLLLRQRRPTIKLRSAATRGPSITAAAAAAGAHRKSSTQPLQLMHRPSPSRVDRLGRWLLTLWGAVVVAVHLHAASHGANAHCMTQVRPWFARRAACSLMEINCARDASLSDGGARDFDDAMATVDRQWVAYLIVRHCARVELTPTFQQLRNLMGLKLYNATLARWDSDAALTQQHHPNAMLVFLVATDMAALPRGLYAAGRDFPRRLMDIEICRSNLSTLPDAVADAWPRDLFLLLEDLRLDALPDVVARLQPSSLSLAMNAFSTLPPALFEGPSLSWLQLNGNPIVALPTDVRVACPLQFLFLEGTDVATLPPWLDLAQVYKIQAAGTPLCDALQRGEAPQGDHEVSLASLRRVVRCPTPMERRYLYNYPLADEAIANP
ncbi:hypothetical protein PINS_up009502 [Pythium insidiosum]|nr:hypothetical protein PINS_up009502 [Pythium insidiosum]